MNALQTGAVAGATTGGVTTAAVGYAYVTAVAGLSSPAANLGGYVVAQQAASWAGVASGAQLSAAIASAGGPAVVAAGVAVGAGLAVGGLVVGAVWWACSR